MKKIIIFICFLLISTAAFSQCEDSSVNCTGDCKDFADANKDGFCDESIIDSSKFVNHNKTVSTTSSIKEAVITKDSTEKKAILTTTAKKQLLPKQTDSQLFQSPETTALQQEIKTVDVTAPPVKKVSKKKTSPYHFLSVLIPLLIAYVGMDQLAKHKKIKKLTFYRTWNVLLLITFTVSALLGLLITAKLIYQFHLPYLKPIYILHVDFGVAMSVISLFHVYKHWAYYTKILRSNKA